MRPTILELLDPIQGLVQRINGGFARIAMTSVVRGDRSHEESVGPLLQAQADALAAADELASLLDAIVAVGETVEINYREPKEEK